MFHKLGQSSWFPSFSKTNGKFSKNQFGTFNIFSKSSELELNRFVKGISILTENKLFVKQRKENFYGWATNNSVYSNPVGSASNIQEAHATTVLSLRKKGKVVIISDGQVTMGSTIVKGNAKKVRRLGLEGSVLAGFAGSTADAFALFERLEGKLETYPGQLLRACVDMAKLWRTDRYLRRLEALMIVCDKDHSLMLTGSGDVQEFQDGLIAIGSGGPYAFSSAKALVETVPDMDIEEIAKKSMQIAASICIYTNNNFTMETLSYDTTTSKAQV